MTLTQELRHQHHDLWHGMVTHPFVVEMGDGTLPVAKFRAYFLQDYVFVHDLVALISMGLAKAPTFLAANQLHQFLAGILNPEGSKCRGGRWHVTTLARALARPPLGCLDGRQRP